MDNITVNEYKNGRRRKQVQRPFQVKAKWKRTMAISLKADEEITPEGNPTVAH